jgi:surface-anchored protein
MTPLLANVTLLTDPAWPWSTPVYGLPALASVATLLVVMTVWTYRGVPGAVPGRVLLLIGLRLAALLMAVLACLRPSVASQQDLHSESTLLVLADASESMTIQDALDSRTRWDAIKAVLSSCQARLTQLKDEQNINVQFHRFAADLGDYQPDAKPDGKRTDFGTALHTLLERSQHERRLRGLLILSDGANNGTRYPVGPLASKWRSLPCPIHTFGVGRETTSSKNSDLSFVDIAADPSPVAVKGELTVKGRLNAAGLKGVRVKLRLLINDEEVAQKDEVLPEEVGNEVSVSCDAPARAGEIKVTLKVDPLRNEAIRSNNEISTYVTVTKEGVNILYVEGKLRAGEPQFIRRALARDPRFRLYESVRLTADPPPGGEADLFQFDKRAYDVIILGDVSPNRFSGGQPKLLDDLARQVQHGAGLLMIGGYDSFTSRKADQAPPNDTTSWRETPIAALLPVELNADGQIERDVKMVPTVSGLEHYLLRLASPADANAAVWKRLPKLKGMNKLGTAKVTATVLARADDAQNGPLLLVGHKVGGANRDGGRVLAFAADTTSEWHKLGLPESKEGLELLNKFWKQMILWLAQQDEGSGSVWVRPDLRRLPAGGKVEFSTGVRGKTGVALGDGKYEVTVDNPKKAKTPIQTARQPDVNEERGTFLWTEEPGEYTITVKATAKDVDGKEISDTATSRFLVYQDDTELARQAADLTFLQQLADNGGGQFHRIEELERFLHDLPTKLPLHEATSTARLRPDWRSSELSGFIVGYFLTFVGIVCLEWLLRRSWGLV